MPCPPLVVHSASLRAATLALLSACGSRAKRPQGKPHRQAASPDGTYTVRAQVVSVGGQNYAFLSAKDYGGRELKANIPASGWPNWQELTIQNVRVTNGQITVGVYSNAKAGNWLSVDDVRVERQ